MSKENKEIKKSEEKKEDKKNTKDVKEDKLENLKKEELLLKHKEESEKFLMEKMEKMKIIGDLNKNIETKETVLSELTQKNRKLYKQLEEMQKEIDEKLEKVSSKKVAHREKVIQEQKLMSQNENSKGKNLKIKDLELKNAFRLVEILKKDKQNLELNLKENSDLDKVLKLEEKKKNLEIKNQSLGLEIKELLRLVDKHKRCPENSKNFDEDLRTMNEEIYQLKLKQKDIHNKISEEQNKHLNTKTQLENIKTDYTSLTGNCYKLKQEFTISSKNNVLGNHNINNNKVNRNSQSNSQGYKPFFNQYDPYAEVVITKKKKSLQKKREKFEEAFKNEFEASPRGSFQSAYLSKSLLITNSPVINNNSQDQEINKLFLPKEKMYLQKFFKKEEIDKYEEKYEKVEKSRVEAEKNYKSEMKEMNKDMASLHENIKLTTLELKEIDQKSKIYNFKINEYKSDQTIQHEKIIEIQRKIEIMNHTLKEKSNENQILLSQITQLQKLNKYQLDREFQKKRNKGQESDSLDESKSKIKSLKSEDHDDINEEMLSKYNLKPQKNKGLD